MADISKINPNGTEYNLKDATARSAIENTNENIQSSITVPKASVVTVADAAPINAEDITVDITPIQDLHGYDRPWAGGAGKNKLQNTGASTTNNGVTSVVNADGSETLNRTSSSENWAVFDINTRSLPAGSYKIVNSFASNAIFVRASYNNSGGTAIAQTSTNAVVEFTISQTENVYFGIFVRPTATPSNLTVYPMLLLGTETDTTWSPYSNICPIEGRTGAELDRVGKNWLPMTVANLKSINNAYSSAWNGNTYTVLGMSYEIKTDTDGRVVGINVNGTTSAYPMFYLFKGTLPLDTYTFNTNSNIRYRIYKGTSLIHDGTVPKTFTVSDSTVDYEIYIFTGATTVNNEMAYPMIRLASITDSTYEPYQGQQYTVSFGETVYGGKWHVTEGGTDKTHANIANYNGETINEPWLSSLDEYSPGATPTTGAQVVYPLITPTAISTPKQNVPMLQGINTVSADCGDVSLKYQPDNVIGELKGEIEDSIIYEDFRWKEEGSITYSAGTPGTYATSTYRDVAKEGYDVIGVTFVENRQLGNCILTLNYIPSTKRVEVIIFRATSSSVTVDAEDITYRVAYKKH